MIAIWRGVRGRETFCSVSRFRKYRWGV